LTIVSSDFSLYSTLRQRERQRSEILTANNQKKTASETNYGQKLSAADGHYFGASSKIRFPTLPLNSIEWLDCVIQTPRNRTVFNELFPQPVAF
jgi:hypothetical protein